MHIPNDSGVHSPGQPQPAKARIVRCPQCSADAVYGPENPWRPFCCERCKLIDMGAWANDSYRIPVQEESTDPETAPPGE